ncbi:unnamed protein product [Penicillium bialowiezense]
MNHVSKKRERTSPSPNRAQHLERNRTAANKYRQKKKKEHDEIDHKLHDETEKRELLLSQVHSLQKEVWDLKNMIFQHAGCDHGQQSQAGFPSASADRAHPNNLSFSSQPSQSSYRTDSSPTHTLSRSLQQPAGLAQSVERKTLNLKAAGSTPAFGSS